VKGGTVLLIECPHCGPRDETEFTCGGEGHIVRPELDVSDQGWADYLFNRTNARGVSFERWRHSYGCGSWFNAVRDTSTHEISAIYAMTDPKPVNP
jgi:sarcosine oxidase subunit delta